jgi:hypothetical protein
MIYCPCYRLVGFSIFILIFSCGRNPMCQSENPCNPIILYTGDTIANHVGDTAEIKILNEASDGGYRCYVTIMSDSTIASLVSYSTALSSDARGAPVYETWRYRLNHTGNDIVILKLYRPWDAGNVIATKSIYLSVQD